MKTLVAPELVKEFSIPVILQQVTFTIFDRQVIDYYYQSDPNANNYILQDLEEYFVLEFNEKPTFHKIKTFERVGNKENGKNILKQVNFLAEITYATETSFERKLVNNILHFVNTTEIEAINQVIKLFPISTINNITSYKLTETHVISDPNTFQFNYFKQELLKSN